MSELPSHSGLFKRIREDNSVEALQSARHYANTACKISRTYQHIAFSQRCRRYQLLPRSLEVKPVVSIAQGRLIAQRTGFQFLAARVQHCYRKLKRRTSSFRSANWTMPLELRSLKHLRSLSLTPRQGLSSRRRNNRKGSLTT